MVQAIRDQWAVIVAVIVLVGLVVGLWRTRSKRSR
jgi:FtsZ-interacting cell division protein ZipA